MMFGVQRDMARLGPGLREAHVTPEMTVAYQLRPHLVPPAPKPGAPTSEMSADVVLRPDLVAPSLRATQVPPGLWDDSDPHRPEEVK